MEEQVNHPAHYQQGIEPIEVIESWDLNFSLGNAIKYILRSPYKGKQIEDLEKARWYIDREIERLKKEKDRDILQEIKNNTNLSADKFIKLKKGDE